MLSRFISKPSSHLRFLTLITSKPQCSSYSLHSSPNPNPIHSPTPNLPFILALSRSFCSDNRNGDDNGSGTWKISPENDPSEDSIFGEETGTLDGTGTAASVSGDKPWAEEKGKEVDVFADVDKEIGAAEGGGGDQTWMEEKGEEVDVFAHVDNEVVATEGYGARGGGDGEEFKPWSVGEEDKDMSLFDVGDEALEPSIGLGESIDLEAERQREAQKIAEETQLREKEQELTAVLKGPNRAFGDLIAASGITNAMLDNLIALKDFEGIEGLPPLSKIEEMRIEKKSKKSTRAEIERLKQEEVAKARVRRVDDKGRAYGTGRRKCSVARVWIQPGEGKFVVNDKQFDVYFPGLDNRSLLLRPFVETKTLGLWDVSCTVKGGGISGQVGAIRLGISRALQCWEPGFRPPLKFAGFMTRDPRMVERKKPGRAKARKSFQWVKR